MTERFLPYGRQLIDDADRRAVASVLEGDVLTTGPYVDAFEQGLCRTTGASHAAVCSSGTAALHLAALALGLGTGDRVIVPAVTFAATANAARYVGADVIFADIDPDTGLMTAETLAAALSTDGERRARAVFPVHLAGHTAEMEGIAAVARERGLAIVEDASHAIGGRVDIAGDWIPVGACRHSDMATFSFHPVKTITSGEGGAVTSNDVALAARLKRFRNHGIVRESEDFVQPQLAFDADGGANPWYYEIGDIGLNYRITDIQCALGLSQLGKLEGFVVHRARLLARYREALASLAPAVRPLASRPGCRPGWHLAVVLIDFAALGIDRATVMRRMAERGIGTQVHYMPLHLQPCYRELYGPLSLPGAETYYAKALSLPLFAGMMEPEVDRVTAALADALGLGG